MIERAKEKYRKNPGPTKMRAKRQSKENYEKNPDPKRTYEREKARALTLLGSRLLSND